MVHHPLILGPKLVLLVLLVVVLVILHGHLTGEQFVIAVVVSIAVFVGGTVALWIFALKVLNRPNSKLGQRLILSRRPVSEEGGPASTEGTAPSVGSRGVTVSPLRPSGIASFEGQRVRVVTDGLFMPVGSPVEIVSVQRSRIVVQSVPGSVDQPR